MDNLNKQPYYNLNININDAVSQDFDYRSFVNQTGNFNLRIFNHNDVKNIINYGAKQRNAEVITTETSIIRRQEGW
jgi:hypothetical protein